MARIRTVKPEFWKNEGLSELPEATHMLAAALLNYADDFGYFNANPKLIKSECFPLRELSVSIPESLRSLQTIVYIKLGTGDDGRRYGQVIEFSTHQRVSHPTPSKIATLSIAWDDNRNPPEQFAKPPEPLRPEGKGTGNREVEQGREKVLSAVADAPASQPEVVEAEFVEDQPPPSKPASVQMEIPAFLKREPPPPAAVVEVAFDPVDRALEAYHRTVEYAEGQGATWARCVQFSAQRRAAMRKRLDECGGIQGWCELMARAARSSFLMGKTGRSSGHENWKVGLDFFLQPKTFNKLREGSYDDTPGNSASGGSDALSAGFARAAAAYGD